MSPVPEKDKRASSTPGSMFLSWFSAGLVDQLFRGLQDPLGSGNFVGTASSSDEGLLFGLLIPNLGDTEIFGPICQGMSEAPQARKNALLWGNSVSDARTNDEQALQLCQQYISKKVAGVFFAPLERITGGDQANHRGVAAMAAMLERVTAWQSSSRD